MLPGFGRAELGPERGAADLVILAAQDFTAEPVARVHLPARILLQVLKLLPVIGPP